LLLLYSELTPELRPSLTAAVLEDRVSPSVNDDDALLKWLLLVEPKELETKLLASLPEFVPFD
jgi:hypothetical protein